VTGAKKKKIQTQIKTNHFLLRMIIVINMKMQAVSFLPLSTSNNQLSTRALGLFFARTSGARDIIKG